MEEEATPLILDPVEVETNATHLECLGVEFLETISMVLVIGTDGNQCRTRNSFHSWKMCI